MPTSNYYRPHPKDGEGNVFSLSTPGGRGWWGGTLSHNALQHFPECHGADTRGGTLPGGTLAGGYPSRGGTLVGQQKEYSIHGGRYASCVHAGGLSCYNRNLIAKFVQKNNSTLIAMYAIRLSIIED